MAKLQKEIDDFPNNLRLFPLSNVLLLPNGNLPLNIFEPRYIEMVDDALRTDRLIGMIQYAPHAKEGDADLYKIGCAGRITSFEETDDGRYIINLSGLCRFEINDELDTIKPYRQFSVTWDKHHNDLSSQDAYFKNRNAVLDSLKQYFERQNMICDWEVVKQTTDAKLITLLSMICPFSAHEKQALLEADTPCCRADMLFSLLEMEAILDCNLKTDQSKH
ncbi:MAG: peptidase S16 [Rickettsiales bacterium]|nr:peptidase S16 [Rickettsiales bacterium]